MATTKILKLFLQSLFLTLCFPFQGFAQETDIITSTSSIKDPGFIVSRNPVFKLGFFSPDNTTNRYLAIFYVVSERDVIWIANRDRPLTDSSGTVTISADGNLVLRNGRNETVWSTNVSTNGQTSATAQIQDNGNLILRDDSAGNMLWDSFSHPTNVFVPSLNLIDNTKTGNKLVMSSWKNDSDPEVGRFTTGLVALNIPQIFTWKDGKPYWRSGPWNGQILMGVRLMYSPYLDGYSIVNNSGTFYFTAPRGRHLKKIHLSPSGSLEKTMWDPDKKKWVQTWFIPETQCDIYGLCGPFGSCNTQGSSFNCSCLRGFEPSDKVEWRRGNWTGGCVRRTPLQCGSSNEDRFLRLPFMKLPDFPQQVPFKRADECQSICLRNCSCIAYAHDPNLGCMFWSGRLFDVMQFPGVGPDLYIRLASSELGGNKDKKLIIIIPAVAGFVCISISVFIVWRWMGRKKGEYRRKDHKNTEAKASDSSAIVLKDDSEKVDIKELPLFSFDTVADATNGFHHDNLLGKGGFGSVYKGKLTNGKEIGVKRLSAASGQGGKEFMNEVIVISKLQHRNLVRLIGCCVDKQEKMLIYEYMPNKSLDMCLFDPSHPSQKILDWKKRFSIIEGIGRGLLYLHKDSRLRIIHRDLKPSNVLLDGNWNPKISDFGMARIFGGNEDQANTLRVVGTYGYMAPEYAMEGTFSEKSDVYSFGVLMLEIVSGKKNTQYYNEELSLSLLGFAWKLWNENNGMAFVDQMVASSDFQDEMVRCIHIALLCVQEYPKDRPCIQTALSMLSHEITDLPLPEQPLFSEKCSHSDHVGSTQSNSLVEHSVNELTVTVLDGR